ncbi:MAG: transposase [Muribaculaceae bacterium]|nr:transposase [Muribaculaceae bacterium]
MDDNNDNFMVKRISPRAKWSKYAGGLFFVTIVTRDRRHFFGKISNGVMHLYPSGQIAKAAVLEIENLYPYCKLLNHVVMPNHIHLVIFIDEKLLPHEKRNLDVVNGASNQENKATKCVSWLSVVIGHLKSFISRKVHVSGHEFNWQERYHDHIIRNMDDYLKISNYIDNNIKGWESDCFNKND